MPTCFGKSKQYSPLGMSAVRDVTSYAPAEALSSDTAFHMMSRFNSDQYFSVQFVKCESQISFLPIKKSSFKCRCKFVAVWEIKLVNSRLHKPKNQVYNWTRITWFRCLFKRFFFFENQNSVRLLWACSANNIWFCNNFTTNSTCTQFTTINFRTITKLW